MQISRKHFYVMVYLMTGLLRLPLWSFLLSHFLLSGWPATFRANAGALSKTWPGNGQERTRETGTVRSSSTFTCTLIHTHNVRTAFSVVYSPSIFHHPLPAEGVEESCGRYGGTDSALARNHPAGKQNSRVGGESTQWRKVWLNTHGGSNKKQFLYLNMMSCVLPSKQPSIKKTPEKGRWMRF